MARKKKPRGEIRNKYVIVRLTQEEFDALSKATGHYRKSDYVRKAIKVQMASDKIRGAAG